MNVAAMFIAADVALEGTGEGDWRKEECLGLCGLVFKNEAISDGSS